MLDPHPDTRTPKGKLETRTGVMIRPCECSSCGELYLTKIERSASVPIRKGFLERTSAARIRATLDAEDILFKQLVEGVEPIPCPKCNRLSNEMLTEVSRREAERGPQPDRWKFGAAGLAFSFFAYLALDFNGHRQVMGFGGVLGGMILAALSGSIFLTFGLLERYRKTKLAPASEDSWRLQVTVDASRHNTVAREEAIQLLDQSFHRLEQERAELPQPLDEVACQLDLLLWRRADAIRELREELLALPR